MSDFFIVFPFALTLLNVKKREIHKHELSQVWKSIVGTEIVFVRDHFILNSLSNYKKSGIHQEPRKHSSRMRTARLLPVSPSMRCSWLGGSTCSGMVYLPGGCACPGGVPARRGVPAQGVPAGGVPARGVPAQVLPPVNRILDTRY